MAAVCQGLSYEHSGYADTVCVPMWDLWVSIGHCILEWVLHLVSASIWHRYKRLISRWTSILLTFPDSLVTLWFRWRLSVDLLHSSCPILQILGMKTRWVSWRVGNSVESQFEWRWWARRRISDHCPAIFMAWILSSCETHVVLCNFINLMTLPKVETLIFLVPALNHFMFWYRSCDERMSFMMDND